MHVFNGDKGTVSKKIESIVEHEMTRKLKSPNVYNGPQHICSRKPKSPNVLNDFPNMARKSKSPSISNNPPTHFMWIYYLLFNI